MSENLIRAGAIFGDPTRCEIIANLMDGRAFTATELASMSHIAPSTASHHLSLLVEAGILTAISSGRYRYFQIKDASQADLIETFGALATPNRQNNGPLSTARSCYNHLAGRLGVELRDQFVRMNWLEEVENNYRLTSSGAEVMQNAGIALPDQRARMGKMCLDWTERKYHIGPPLGSYLLTQFQNIGWLETSHIPRQILITKLGKEQLERLGVFAEERR
ncbi:MAG: ArsR/SmtB family transcription factor [Fimbriimonas sp.]